VAGPARDAVRFAGTTSPIVLLFRGLSKLVNPHLASLASL